MPWLYILECCDGTFYTGSIKDLEKRIKEHQNGQRANYTKDRLPVKLIYTEEYRRVVDAFLREKQIQNWSHDKKRALIEKKYSELHILAICRSKKRRKSIG
jgi:putative endonuclease